MPRRSPDQTRYCFKRVVIDYYYVGSRIHENYNCDYMNAPTWIELNNFYDSIIHFFFSEISPLNTYRSLVKMYNLKIINMTTNTAVCWRKNSEFFFSRTILVKTLSIYAFNSQANVTKLSIVFYGFDLWSVVENNTLWNYFTARLFF